MVSFQSEHYPEERRVEIVPSWDTSATCGTKQTRGLALLCLPPKDALQILTRVLNSLVPFCRRIEHFAMQSNRLPIWRRYPFSQADCLQPTDTL
jgi:hypothetical protein